MKTNKANANSAKSAKPAKTALNRPNTSKFGRSVSQWGGKTAGDAIRPEIRQKLKS